MQELEIVPYERFGPVQCRATKDEVSTSWDNSQTTPVKLPFSEVGRQN